MLDRLGLNIDPRLPASRLKVAEQQMVEIAKALSHNAKIVVMDEPTTSLTIGKSRLFSRPSGSFASRV